MEDEIELAWKDLIIRTSDLALLADGQWLNDVIVDFALEYLVDIVFQAGTLAFPMPAAMAHLIRDIQDPSFLEAALPMDQLRMCQYILVPVNNNHSELAGGTHWSLLIGSDDGEWMHFDSAGSMNSTSARDMTRALCRLSVTSAVDMKQCRAVQQSNSYDCGVMVILHAWAYLAARLKRDASPEFDCLKMRERISQWIQELKQQ